MNRTRHSTERQLLTTQKSRNKLHWQYYVIGCHYGPQWWNPILHRQTFWPESKISCCHYIAHCRNDNKWYQFNDLSSHISHSPDVLRPTLLIYLKKTWFTVWTIQMYFNFGQYTMSLCFPYTSYMGFFSKSFSIGCTLTEVSIYQTKILVYSIFWLYTRRISGT